MTDRYTKAYWESVMSGTGIYWNFDCVVYLKMKNILENILEYTGISEKNQVDNPNNFPFSGDARW